MNEENTFFISGPASDREYVRVRDLPHLNEVRLFVEELWREYKGLEDPHFLVEAKSNFLQRFWEMYVAVALQRKGMVLFKASGQGPEFYFMHQGRKVWVEAVVPSPGAGPDAVAEPLRGKACDVPQERIILRYTNALGQKLQQYNRALRKGIIDENDHYVVALNCRGVRPERSESVLPYGVMACLPFGNRKIVFDEETKVVDSHFSYRSKVVKSSGEHVSTDLFLDPEFKGVTGLLHSAVDPVKRLSDMAGDFWFLHNPRACVPFEESPFKFCKQYFFKESRLSIIEADKSI